MCDCENHKIELDRKGYINTFRGVLEQVVKYRCTECGREWTVTVDLGKAKMDV